MLYKRLSLGINKTHYHHQGHCYAHHLLKSPHSPFAAAAAVAADAITLS